MLRIIYIIRLGALVHFSWAAVQSISIRSGCYHNGTLFAEGAFVPTMEPCLNCKCAVNTLICSLRVCPEMPVPPPRGCVLVQKKNGCCPYLSCSKLHASYDGPNRRIVAYLDHYERETIDRMVNDNVVQRRSDDIEMDGSSDICILNGTVYKSGSAMSSSSLCSYCYCIGGVQKCVKPKCMLNMQGCTPIFVDSTCCPVRYDCTSKNSGIVKASRIHIRRSGNKHYLRTTGRLQKNRGCIINSTYYPEGQKMPTDPDKHCDICFCIRGSQKCAPKICTPAMKNCIPVVPKGQCCPSSYDCNSTREPGRQFDLFSLLFGPGNGKNPNSPSLAPTVSSEGPLTSTEKTFLEAIREGLEFIDKNESTVGDVLKNFNLVNVTNIPTTQAPTSPLPSRVGEDNLTLLDILLGKGDKQLTSKKGVNNRGGAAYTISTTYDQVAFTENPTSTLEYSSEDIQEDYGLSSTIEAEASTILWEEYSTSTESWTESSSTYEDFSTENTSTLVYMSTEIEGKENTVDILSTTSSSAENITSDKDELDASIDLTTVRSAANKIDFFSAIFSGLTSILEPKDNKTEILLANATDSRNTTILPTIATSAEESISNTTHKAINLASLSVPTTETNSAAKAESDIKILTPQHSEKPLIIKTIPSIMEADYSFDYNEPTLPPSLPNLKIIPFLPADAVKSDRKHINFDYYKHKPTAYPSITEKHESWGQVPTVTKIDYDIVYDHTSYPTITETYDNPTSIESSAENKKYSFSSFDYTETDEKYLEESKFVKPTKYEDHTKEYDTVPGYDKFVKTEAPTASLSFDSNINRFSPPTKTEGGFVPKDPMQDHFYYENFHPTKFLIDLTTAASMIDSTKVNIGIASPDPFKNVIKTEPPPDLLSLIEDKEKLLANSGVSEKFYNTGSNAANSEFDRDIISITTDATYNFTSEYKDAFNHPNITQDSYEKITQTTTQPLQEYNPTSYVPTILSTTDPEIPEKNTTIKPPSSEEDFNFGAELESVFKLFLRDTDKNISGATVPPFKMLQSDDPKYELINTYTPSSTDLNLVEDLSVFKDILISNYHHKVNEEYKSSLNANSTPTTTKKPYKGMPNEMSALLSEPFNKLPFINPSFQVKPQDINQIQKNYHYNPLTSDLDLILPEEELETRSNFKVEGYKVLSNDSIISQTDSYVINPVDIIKLKQHQFEGGAQVFAKPDTTNSIHDPAGILKLAGCNIYGRMYRVGRIISELSGPCLECKCTEIGVNCTPLNC